jgi:hypothetical protein
VSPQDQLSFEIEVEGVSRSAAGAQARALSDAIVGIGGVVEARRARTDDTAMDIGSIIQVIATSGATMAIAEGIAAWLQARRGVSLRIKSDKLEAEVHGVDPHTASRILQVLNRNR